MGRTIHLKKINATYNMPLQQAPLIIDGQTRSHNQPDRTMPGAGFENEKWQWLQEHSETINNLILAAIAGLARWTLKPDVNFKKGALRFSGGVLLALTVGIVARKSEWLHSPTIYSFIIAFTAIAGDRIVKMVLDNAPEIGRWLLIRAGAWASKSSPDEQEPPDEEIPENKWKHNHPPQS